MLGSRGNLSRFGVGEVCVVIQVATLLVVVFGYQFGKKQLRQMKLASDVEFLRDTTQDLVSKDYVTQRGMIYREVPLPHEDDKRHEAWLAEISNRPKPPIAEAIDAQLYEFDRIALFFRMTEMKEELVLGLYYDVLARFCFLLQRYLQREIQNNRGGGFMVYFRWLARRNLAYVENWYKRKRPEEPGIKLMRGHGGGSFELSVDDLRDAIDVIETPQFSSEDWKLKVQQYLARHPQKASS